MIISKRTAKRSLHTTAGIVLWCAVARVLLFLLIVGLAHLSVYSVTETTGAISTAIQSTSWAIIAATSALSAIADHILVLFLTLFLPVQIAYIAIPAWQNRNKPSVPHRKAL